MTTQYSPPSFEELINSVQTKWESPQTTTGILAPIQDNLIPPRPPQDIFSGINIEELFQQSGAEPGQSRDVLSSELQQPGTLQKPSKSSDKPASPLKKVIKIVSNLCFWAICISLVVGSVLFAISNDPQKSYLGYRTYNVLTESMTPRPDGSSPPGGFKKGAVILVRMCQPEDINVGDIITFNPNANDTENTMFLTHRVVEVKHELGGKEGIFFVTRGDFNNSDDPPISSEMLIGKKVFHIPGVGGLLQKVRENFILSIVTLICLFACIFLFRWYFAAPKQARMQRHSRVSGSLAASF